MGARPHRDAHRGAGHPRRVGNTASAGSLIAFSLHSDDLAKGNFGLMCSFGAGYSLGSLLLQRM